MCTSGSVPISDTWDIQEAQRGKQTPTGEDMKASEGFISEHGPGSRWAGLEARLHDFLAGASYLSL